MNDITSDTPMHTETTSGNQQAPAANDEATLERQMTELGLSNDTRRFLRQVHLAEKQLNNAFSKSRQGGELEEQVSQVYCELYGAGGAVRASR
jgi:serine protease inhibitor ecotin